MKRALSKLSAAGAAFAACAAASRALALTKPAPGTSGELAHPAGKGVSPVLIGVLAVIVIAAAIWRFRSRR